LAPSQIFLP